MPDTKVDRTGTLKCRISRAIQDSAARGDPPLTATEWARKFKCALNTVYCAGAMSGVQNRFLRSPRALPTGHISVNGFMRKSEAGSPLFKIYCTALLSGLMLEQIGVGEGDMLAYEIKDGKIIVSKARKPAKDNP